MSDFSDALQQRLSSNAELAAKREAAEEEMQRAREAAEHRHEQTQAERRARHGELAEHLKTVADQLKASRPDHFIVRMGWTETGEEFVAKMSTRQMTPKRTLFIELDHDDDQVMAQWTSGIGNAIELWRVLEVTPPMLTEMVLQVADDRVWTGRRPPSFPTPPGSGE